MEKLQKNKHKKLFINKNVIAIFIIYFVLFRIQGFSQSKEVYADRFYKTVDSILECKKPCSYIDTIYFIRKSLVSYEYNEVSYNFDSFLKCHEKNYTNPLKAGDSGIPEMEIVSAYGPTDKKYILLFYIENYLMANILKRDSVPNNIDVYTPISLKHIKSGKLTVMGRENDQKQLNYIYKKLIKIYGNQKLISKLIHERISPLEYVGYTFIFSA